MMHGQIKFTHRRIKHTRKERGLDPYPTDPAAVRALLRVERLMTRIWEPACGRGQIVGELRRQGHIVHASDLKDYGLRGAVTRDFFDFRRAIDGAPMIVTNPPYYCATEFAEHALKLCPRVALLLPITFLESVKREPVLDRGRLARVHVFVNRLPMMHREGWKGRRADSSRCYAWFVWRGSRGPAATINRITWE